MRNIIRRALLSFVLLTGVAPAFGQVPPPIPALPDTERRTSYSITASLCSCNVNFALYGDSTDVGNWLEVFVGGVKIAQSGNWTITSPANPGGLATAPRPITDAVLTFTAAQTGTVQIVGARRPRRASQFTTQPSARDFNQVLTDIIAQNRETWDKLNDVTGRTVQAPPGETLAILPALASRQNMGACFDSGGNLQPCVAASGSFIAGGGITFTGTNPTTISNNLAALILPTNIRSAYSSTNSLATSDCGKTVALGGSAFFTFTVGAASGFPANCQVVLVNEDNVCPSNGASTCRAKNIGITGYSAFFLWPGQLFHLVNQNNVWQFNAPGRWYANVNMTWYVNHASGAVGNDCLQPGAAACANIQQAIFLISQQFDCSVQVNPTIQVAAETFTESNVIMFGEKPCYHEIFITGSPGTPSSTVWQVGAGNVGIQTRDYGIVTLNGFKFVSLGNSSTAFSATQMGVIDFMNIEFGLFANGTHISCVNNAGINWTGGTYVVSGNMANHVTANGPCMITIAGATISVPNALTFTNWAQAQAVGILNFGADTFTGTGAGAGSTGAKYNVSLNAVLVLSGVVLPGATAGATASGGQVQ